MNEFTQRNQTNNQSTADYTFKHGFLWDNKYSDSIFNNNTGAELTLQPMTLVIRNSSDATQVIPAVSGATLVSMVGITANEKSIVLADGETQDLKYCNGGGINKNFVVLPTGVTFETIVSGKTVADHLEALGFDLMDADEHTKLDN